MTAADLKHVAVQGDADRMITLGELCDLVGGPGDAGDRAQEPLRRRPAARSRAPPSVLARLSRTGGGDVVRSRPDRGGARRSRPRSRAAWSPRAAIAITDWDQLSAAHQARARLFRARAAHPPAVHRLFGEGPAGARSRACARKLFGLPLLTWTVRTDADRQRARTLGRPDDLRRISAVKLRINDRHEGCTPNGHGRDRTHAAGCQRDRRHSRRGLGRLRQSRHPASLPRGHRWLAGLDIKDRLQPIHIARFSVLRSNSPARSARAPAGSRCTSSPRTPSGQLVGAVPCYAKSHSQGEYVFDHGWAEAYERAGGSYYPKLQVSVPFTPATGRRLLVRPGPQADAVARRSPTGWPKSAGARMPPRCTSPS